GTLAPSRPVFVALTLVAPPGSARTSFAGVMPSHARAIAAKLARAPAAPTVARDEEQPAGWMGALAEQPRLRPGQDLQRVQCQCADQGVALRACGRQRLARTRCGPFKTCSGRGSGQRAIEALHHGTPDRGALQ